MSITHLRIHRGCVVGRCSLHRRGGAAVVAAARQERMIARNIMIAEKILDSRHGGTVYIEHNSEISKLSDFPG